MSFLDGGSGGNDSSMLQTVKSSFVFIKGGLNFLKSIDFILGVKTKTLS
jgi:hypothetical protein